jgi:hypothetical protein
MTVNLPDMDTRLMTLLVRILFVPPAFGIRLWTYAACGGGQIQRAFAIYLGEHPLRFDHFTVLPLVDFLVRLNRGAIINSA